MDVFISYARARLHPQFIEAMRDAGYRTEAARRERARREADGAAIWARWSPGVAHVSGNMQVHLTAVTSAAIAATGEQH